MFAAVLHERTGWPIFGVYHPGGGPGMSAPMHWVCRTPDGLFADASGQELVESDLQAEYRLWIGQLADLHEADLQEVMKRFRRPADDYRLARDEHLDLLLPGLPQIAAAPGSTCR